jgi:hypothetical protein
MKSTPGRLTISRRGPQGRRPAPRSLVGVRALCRRRHLSVTIGMVALPHSALKPFFFAAIFCDLKIVEKNNRYYCFDYFKAFAGF